MIAQVDEDQVAMIPLAVHPTGHPHLIADLRRRKGAAGVGAIGMHGVFGLSASFYANDKLLQRRYGQSCQARSEEHTSELQSLMRISYAVFCLKKKTRIIFHYLDT